LPHQLTRNRPQPVILDHHLTNERL
jgi:hypothetical protein